MPALSETFVYEELLALERRGISVVPFSVRQPSTLVAAQQALAQRVGYLYDGNHLALILGGLWRVPGFGQRAIRAVRYLAGDVRSCGLLQLASWKLVYQFLAGVKLAVLLKQRGCTHLHVHFAHVPTQIAMYAATLADVPFTVMAHANDIFDHGLLLKEKCQRSFAFLTISEFNRAYLESLGLQKEKIAVVRCGVSFVPRHATPAVVENRPYQLGSLGRMVEKKGFDVLLQAVASLIHDGYSIELSLAGEGPLLAELKLLTTQLGIANSVRFLGKLDHLQVATWLQQLDVFVLACKKDMNGDMDGIPVVLMEAMSQCVPVISTRLSGIPELVMHGQTGLLAEPGDSGDLAAQIVHFFKDEPLKIKLVRCAVDHVAQEFGQNVNIDRLMHYVVH